MDFDDITFPDDYDPFAPAPINNTTGGSNTDATTNQSGHDSTRDNEVKSKRIQKVKLDENLLLSSKGISRIRYESPFIKFKGRGHEAEDLAKLMRYYQLWAHNLYPRLRYQDFVSRVVKVTPKKRCKVTLTEWQQEYMDKKRESRRGRDEVQDELSSMTLDDDGNADKRINDLNAEIFGGGTSNNNENGSSSGPSESQQDRQSQPRERTIIDRDDDTEMDQDQSSSDEDDQPLFITPKPRQTSQQEEEEEDPSTIEQRRKQKNSRADALAALIAKRMK